VPLRLQIVPLSPIKMVVSSLSIAKTALSPTYVHVQRTMACTFAPPKAVLALYVGSHPCRCVGTERTHHPPVSWQAILREEEKRAFVAVCPAITRPASLLSDHRYRKCSDIADAFWTLSGGYRRDVQEIRENNAD
jgi:hypothetical protein